jgi:hypothetical protein
VFPLNTCVVEPEDDEANAFAIRNPSKSFIVVTDSAEYVTINSLLSPPLYAALNMVHST